MSNPNRCADCQNKVGIQIPGHCSECPNFTSQKMIKLCEKCRPGRCELCKKDLVPPPKPLPCLFPPPEPAPQPDAPTDAFWNFGGPTGFGGC